jgi:hypothetical protein
VAFDFCYVLRGYSFDIDKEPTIMEEHLLSPSLFTKCSFEPTQMHQFNNSQLNIEFIFLFSPSKLCLVARSGERYEFVPYLIVDFLDGLGMLRKT